MGSGSSEQQKGGKRQRTRAKLIEAAVFLAESKGFAAASLDDIAARAGMSKGAIYSNFQSKAELVMAVAEAKALRLTPKYVPGAPLKAQLLALADAVLEILPEADGRARLTAEFQAYMAVDPDLRRKLGEVYDRAFVQWSETIARNYGSELTMDSMSLVVALQSLTAGFAHQRQLTPDRVTPEAVRAAFEALAEGAVRRT